MTDVIERDSATPIYQQLEDIFHAKIASGEWAPEHRIPSENELNREYSLSRMTIRPSTSSCSRIPLYTGETALIFCGATNVPLPATRMSRPSPASLFGWVPG
ncbi:GntR family transcriptional regulator [Zafaria sp. J156]|nr:GntR family transcriptional regulator [Zafaria sp. J156]